MTLIPLFPSSHTLRAVEGDPDVPGAPRGVGAAWPLLGFLYCWLILFCRQKSK